jgi:hypothetical protein
MNPLIRHELIAIRMSDDRLRGIYLVSIIYFETIVHFLPIMDMYRDPALSNTFHMNNQLPSSQKPMGRFVDSTPLLNDGKALRNRSELDGYLFFKRLLPAEVINEVRTDLLEVVDRYGWREEGQSPLGGTINIAALNRVPADKMRLDIGVSYAAYDDAQRLESVHRLPHHPKLIQLYRTLFAFEVLVHPRHIIRMITPHQSMVPTPKHQDFPLIQGTTQTWTCWFPLGDCPPELGGLAVQKSSHRLGYLPIQATEGAGGLAAQVCPDEETEWLTSDYTIGDVLTFPSLTVHRGLPCRLKNQIRLSMDVRYQAANDFVEEKSLKPHCNLEWEDIYFHWQEDDLKYYWRQQAKYKMAPWNESLKQPQQRIC